ncbi:MAG: heavy metal-responsive transcriptional regulator [Robiginitomaculum sp.]|nr:heavy metal-responsive transcriptional regulator [Robiginitomaculum sp.]
MSSIAIGQLAKAGNVNIDTVRYYERKNLLLPETRTPSGYRQYSQGSIRRLRFIRKAQGLGFSLKEIGKMLDISGNSNAECGNIKQYAEKKINDIQTRISDLQKIRDGLRQIAQACPGGDSPLENCTILEHFYKNEASQ